jgi:hypothetical protein
MFSDPPTKHDSASRKTTWPPKHRNNNNDKFFSRGKSCFRTRPQNSIQPAERPTRRQSTETPIMRYFLVVGIAVFLYPPPKHVSASRNTNWPPKHRNINNERFFGRGNNCFRTRSQINDEQFSWSWEYLFSDVLIWFLVNYF